MHFVSTSAAKVYAIIAKSKRVFLATCFFFLSLNTVKAQKDSCNSITFEMGYTVSALEIKARWIPEELQDSIQELVGVGVHYDPANLSVAQELLRTALIQSEEQFSARIAGATSVLVIHSDACPVTDTTGAKKVQIKIYPYYLRIDLYNIGNNILPVPRSPRPGFFKKVPASLRATAPLFSINNDRQYGTSLGVQTTTDVLNISGLKKPTGSKGISKLLLEFGGRKSLNESFYDAAVQLHWQHPVIGDSTIGWDIGVNYTRNRQPLGIGEYRKKLFSAYAAIQGSFKRAFFSKYIVGAGARFFNNKYTVFHNNSFQNDENAYHLFALTDGRLGKGFTRLGIWFDAGHPKDSIAFQSYERLAGRLGYATSIGNGHNDFFIETTLGGGYTWGKPPVYNQFFAGNEAQNFLYEPLTYNRLAFFPMGPVVRSLGEKEGGFGSVNEPVNGGTYFWHLNLNVSVPVRRWSRALIPDIVISETPRRRTLRTALKSQVETAKNTIIDDLIETQGYPDNEETEGIAERMVAKDIRPTVNYLADRANLYAIKPLLLFDIANLESRNSPGKTWVATGIGIQVNIVVARLEAGYMHTLTPSSDRSKGNLFVRFTLQNFY